MGPLLLSIILGLTAGLGGIAVALLGGGGLAWPAALAHGLVGVVVGGGAFIAYRTVLLTPLNGIAETLDAMQRDGDLSRRAAVQAGPAGEVLPLHAIAARIVQQAGTVGVAGAG